MGPAVRSPGVLEFTILGPLEARRDGRALDLGGARRRAVLALLLLRAGESVPATRLIDDIWGERPPDTATNVLQSYVSKLRRELGRDSIATRANGYAIVIPEDALDLRIFERTVAAANASPTNEASTALRSALALWRGTPLAEFADQPWAGTAAARLVDMRLAASERALELDLELGRPAEALGEIAQLVAEHPLREQLRRLQLIALYRCGRQADALDAYRQARALLVDQLGIEPGPALREVEQAILRHDEALAAPSPGAKALPAPAEEQRSILVAPQHDAAILPLCSIAEPLARNPRRELIAVRLLGVQDDLARPTADLAALRDELSSRGLAMRVAAYTSMDPAADLVQLATAQASDLLLLDAPAALLEDGVVDETLGQILRDAPCDVAVLAGPAAVHREATRPVVVPFGGNENTGRRSSSPHGPPALSERRSASSAPAPTAFADGATRRLLGKVSLLVQAVVGISPSRCSSGQGRTASSRPHARRNCSCSGSRRGGRRKGSARRDSRSSRQACRPCSCAVASARARSRHARR